MIVTSINDLQALAKRRVARMFYDYVDSGSWTESTYRANAADLQCIEFRQRVAVDLSDRSTRSTMLGQEVAMPVALAPTGLTGMQWADGEILASRAATSRGVPFCLSTMSICSIGDVASAGVGPFWFQLYVMRDRGFVERLIGRARDAGRTALVVTLDLQVIDQRHKGVRNGLSTPPRLTLRSFIDLAIRPVWCMAMLKTNRRRFGNIVGHVGGVGDLGSLSTWVSDQFDRSLTWADIAWIRRLWSGKLVLKGIMDAEDARHARDVGADAIVVSNHGGRQIDGAPSSISVLSEIALALRDGPEIWFDGGIRSGQDVLRALACGARGVLIGRAFLYGLGANGEAGVRLALDIIRRELDTTMAFCGVTDVRLVDGNILHHRPEPGASPSRSKVLMILLRHGPPDAEKPGLLDPEGRLRDLSGIVRDIDGTTISPAGLEMLTGLDPRALPVVERAIRYGACIVRPVNFICIGLNYTDHAAETGARIPDEPIIFLKSLSAYSGPNDDVTIPRGSNQTDWEVELGVVIGTRARYMPERAAFDHVAGYCVGNDLSEREFQVERGGQWGKGKGCDTFGPIGPWLVTKDEIADPHDLALWLDVDGRRMQDGSTCTIIFGVGELVSYVSQFITLHPGDVINTGMPPGVGMGQKPLPIYLRAGQTMRLGILGLGEQRQRAVPA